MTARRVELGPTLAIVARVPTGRTARDMRAARGRARVNSAADGPGVATGPWRAGSDIASVALIDAWVAPGGVSV